MANLIRTVVARIIASTLDKSANFNYSDFIIDIEPRVTVTKVTIIYEYEDQYKAIITIPDYKSETPAKDMDYMINFAISPGELSSTEECKLRGREGLSTGIKKWLDFLWEELLNAPVFRAIEENREEIEALKEKVNGIPDEYFTKEEGEKIKDRLEKLEKQMADRFRQDIPVEAEKQIKKLKDEIETLQKTIFSLKKPGWFKSLLTKTLKIVNNPENIKLAKAAKDLALKMLPEDVSQ